MSVDTATATAATTATTTTTTTGKRYHKRTFTGYSKHILKEEQDQLPKETLALWEKYGVGETDGLYLI